MHTSVTQCQLNHTHTAHSPQKPRKKIVLTKQRRSQSSSDYQYITIHSVGLSHTHPITTLSVSTQ